MRSIQSRLATGLLLSLIILLVAQWIIVATSIELLSEQTITSRMVHTADLLVATMNSDETGNFVMDDSRIDPVFSKPFSGFYYLVRVNSQAFRSRSLWDETLPTVDTTAGSHSTTRTHGPQGQQLLVYSTAYLKQQHTITVTIAEDISDITQNIRSLLINHALVSFVILATLVYLQIIIVRRSLLPLEKIRRDLAQLEKGTIERLDENVPREIFSLVHEINLRVIAFQQRLERSRRATGNLAHALKRPLTLLSQLGQDTTLISNADTRSTLQQYITEIRQIIDRELKRARLSGTVVGTRQANLQAEVNALIKSLQAMYRDKDLEFTFNAPEECTASMDREDFHELLGNILDNACKWATHQVRVSISCDGAFVMTVDDDGSGIPEQQLENILNRGTRLDEQTAGHGLGLAIVKDIVDHYKGTIAMSRSDTLGGLRTVISIPF